jgi:phospholipid/cholesterol/gamma-HCH transport system substrate-binding protein
VDGLAEVAMNLDPAVRVPRGVVARVRRTSVLGERIVDLVVPEGLPASAPPLLDGDEIGETETRADLEDLVVEGADVLAPIAASEVATLVDEGAKGFGGKGPELRTFLTNLSAIVKAYEKRTPALRAAISAMNRFNKGLAPNIEVHAESVANTAQSLRVLREESDELTAAIRSLDRLAAGGRAILDAHADEMDRFFSQMRSILRVLDEERGALVRFLRFAPLHNRNTQITDFEQFVQVYQDFIICGFNDDPDDPARECKE